jgi:hypothetical protein
MIKLTITFEETTDNRVMIDLLPEYKDPSIREKILAGDFSDMVRMHMEIATKVPDEVLKPGDGIPPVSEDPVKPS